MFTERPKRLQAFSYVGIHQYFLTRCTVERAPHFKLAECVHLALSQIRLAADDQRFAIPAYCFMPDHVHLLVEGTCDSSHLKTFVKLAKQRAAYHPRRQHGSRLWQPYFYEHVVRDDERSGTIIQYIVGNPLRSKLVETLEDYPFWGSCTLTREDLLRSIGERPTASRPEGRRYRY